MSTLYAVRRARSRDGSTAGWGVYWRSAGGPVLASGYLGRLAWLRAVLRALRLNRRVIRDSR